MKKKVLSLVMVFVMLFSVTLPVYAEPIVDSGDNVIDDGEYDSLRMVAGKTVTSNANNDGISLLAGNNITLNGNVTYGFLAGNVVTFNGTGKDIFLAGNVITVSENAVMSRDAYIAGNSIVVKANVGRDLRAGGSKINISGITINGDAFLASDEIIMDEDTNIIGKLTYDEDSRVIGLNKAHIGTTEVVKTKEVVIKHSFKNQLYDFIVSLIAAFIVMTVLFFILKNSREKLDKVNLNALVMAKNMGIGLLILIVVPLVVLIALFTGFLAPLGLITGLLLGISIYLAPLLSSYVVGHVINKYLIKNDSVYLSLIIGLLVVRLAKLIPYLGGFVSILAMLYGMGLIYQYMAEVVSKKKN